MLAQMLNEYLDTKKQILIEYLDTKKQILIEYLDTKKQILIFSSWIIIQVSVPALLDMKFRMLYAILTRELPYEEYSTRYVENVSLK